MPKQSELIAICAILMSSVALSIDIMLPALGEIAEAFDLTINNDRQLTVVVLFLGLTFGQLLFGPLSDTTGRKPMIYTGLAVFCAGTVLCVFSTSFEMLLSGRILQGFGAAGPRIVTVALIRDRFEGERMAQIMSIIMGIFIFVPILAPSLGQALLFLMPWRGLFAFVACVGLIGGVWLALRQEETLRNKVNVSFGTYFSATGELVRSRTAMAYSIAGALCYGALMGYINTSQQLFQDTYSLGDKYALWFGASAAFISAATFINAKLVATFRMESVCVAAIGILVVWSLVYGVYFQLTSFKPGLGLWMVYNCVCLFCLGLTFGNFNAIALRDFGHIAGIAAAVVAAINSALSLVIAWLIGRDFDGTVSAMVIGYFACCSGAIALILFLDRSKPWQSRISTVR